jgi:hypothetical protein
MLACCMMAAKAQKKDTVFRKQKLNKLEIELMYSHYMQDGSNSAVTGGIGTEKLTVYSPNVKLKKTWQNQRSLSYKGGSDIISSASTDRIDFVRSSASLIDARTYSNLVFSSPIAGRNAAWSAGTGFSIESDYFSIPVNFGVMMKDKNKMRTLTVDLQMFFDDLRWGRLNPGYYRPVKLIYPEELRGRDWYGTTRRQSYNLKTGLTQVINKRNIMGVYPDISLQHGLLATPFHRVYFKDDSLMLPEVENLPSSRLKFTLGLKLNSFIGGRTILKNAIDVYTDNFGVRSLALENETMFKIGSKFSLGPHARICFQKGSRYFAPYREHLRNEEFYTSDYDLSGFMTIRAGIAMRFAPFRYIGRNNIFNEGSLRYAYLHRSNGLHAHMVSLVLNMTHQSARQKKLKNNVK